MLKRPATWSGGSTIIKAVSYNSDNLATSKVIQLNSCYHQIKMRAIIWAKYLLADNISYANTIRRHQPRILALNHSSIVELGGGGGAGNIMLIVNICISDAKIISLLL
jgi:hypothetical protein